MSTHPHLQILDYSQSTQNEKSNFRLFPHLPKELRLKIWWHALERHRILHVYLDASRWKAATEAGENPESTSIVVVGRHLLSELRVNKESRVEALRFHRVHLPCKFARTAKNRGSTSHGTLLHFNPEWDFLHISGILPMEAALYAFLYRLKAIHDPRHVGLLNLSVDEDALRSIHFHGVRPNELDLKTYSASKETFTQLREVWFVLAPHVGRQYPGSFNRSFPIAAIAPIFDRLHRDPRPIAQSLTDISELARSRDVIKAWGFLMRAFSVSEPKTEYRFHLAFYPSGRRGAAFSRISAKTDAEKWLRDEDNELNRYYKTGELLVEILFNTVRPAFGFWLFPTDVIGPIDRSGFREAAEHRFPYAPLVDPTRHWPELALSSLP